MDLVSFVVCPYCGTLHPTRRPWTGRASRLLSCRGCKETVIIRQCDVRWACYPRQNGERRRRPRYIQNRTHYGLSFPWPLPKPTREAG
jgi:hypothetical protein